MDGLTVVRDGVRVLALAFFFHEKVQGLTEDDDYMATPFFSFPWRVVPSPFLQSNNEIPSSVLFAK